MIEVEDRTGMVKEERVGIPDNWWHPFLSRPYPLFTCIPPAPYYYKGRVPI